MTDRIAKRVKEIDSSRIRLAFELAKEIPNYIDLSIGFPEENTPSNIKAAGISAINKNHTQYLETQGLGSLRQSIATKLNTENRVTASSDSVIVTPGLTTAILLCYLTLLNPGDEILLPEPIFPPYFDLAKLVGAVPNLINTLPSFQLTAELIEKHLTIKTKVLVINSPNNPTGAIYPKAELVKIAALAKRHKLIIISDEIYEYFSYDEAHFSIGSIYKDTMTLNGFSKSYAMTGWRIGYVNGPNDIIEAMTELQQYIVFSSSSIGQYAALEALKHKPQGIVHKYRLKRDLAKDILSQEFTDIKGGQGAFYLFVKIPGSIRDEKFVNLLAHRGVLLLPGSAFSRLDDHVRISFAAESANLKTGLERINESVRILSSS